MVLYLGDLDPAGVLIDVALQKELREHLRNDIELSFKRIAINEEQVEAYGLPTKPRKDGDKRSLQLGYTVEAEAMPARDLRGILRVEVEMLLPDDALHIAKVAEQSERQHLRNMALMFDGGQR